MNCDNLVLLVTAAFSVFANIDLALAKDYYKILGVSRDANDRQIKKAFRKLAMKYHPDKNKQKDAEAKFREIAEGRLATSRENIVNDQREEVEFVLATLRYMWPMFTLSKAQGTI